MNLKPFTGPGSTPSRRRFWDKVTQAVIASQKVAGRFVTIDEHQGKGTVINVGDTSIRRPSGPGACCHPDGSCDIQTQSACSASGGAYQGQGTTCEDVDCTHTGACCYDTVCRIQRADDCTGTYQGDGTGCDPNPCTEMTTGACCVGFECTTETAADCADLGGIFNPNLPCDPTPCCSFCDPLVWQGCMDGEDCRTGPESCDGCGGEIVPCDETFYWYTDIEYCITCPGSTLVECNRLSVNPVTCETTQTCTEEPCCECLGASGTTHEMADRGFPCGACCIDGECSILPEPACDFQGGMWLGAGTDCISDPC